MKLSRIAIVLPVLVYASAMGHLWYKMKSGADEMVASAASFATIEYDSVHVGLLGDEVGLDGIRISPVMTNDQFSVDSVRLSAPYPGYFFISGGQVKKGEMPEDIGMHISKLQVDLGSELFSMLEQMQQQASAANTGSGMPLAGLEAAGCGNVKAFSLDVYRRMGLDELMIDADLEIGYDKEEQKLGVTMNVVTDGLFAFDVITEFDSGPDPRALVTQAQMPSVKLNYKDTGFYRFRNAFCARMNDSSKEEYVDKHIQLLTKALGVTVPENVTASYRKYLLKGGSLSLSIDPEQNVNPQNLKYYPAETIVDMLGLAVAVDGKDVALNELAWSGEGGLPVSEVMNSELAVTESGGGGSGTASSVHQSGNRAATTSIPKFHKVAPNSASRYINYVIKVSTSDGNVRKGRLEKVEESRIYLKVRLAAGTMGYWVDRYSIKQLHVLQ